MSRSQVKPEMNRALLLRSSHTNTKLSMVFSKNPRAEKLRIDTLTHFPANPPRVKEPSPDPASDGSAKNRYRLAARETLASFPQTGDKTPTRSQIKIGRPVSSSGSIAPRRLVVKPYFFFFWIFFPPTGQRGQTARRDIQRHKLYSKFLHCQAVFLFFFIFFLKPHSFFNS